MNKRQINFKLIDHFNSELSRWGVIRLKDNELANRFLEYTKDSPSNIEFMIEHDLLLTVFFYDREMQPNKWRLYGGMCWRYELESGKAAYGIGISKQTIERGKRKTVEMFLHECAHALHGVDHRAHDERFHDLLKVLVDEYNKANGTNYNSN